MSHYTQFCLIFLSVIILINISLAVASEATSESDPNAYCEIFQNINFRGESLQIRESHLVMNLTQITQSWMGSSDEGENEEMKFHSFKLKSLNFPGRSCFITACTRENFSGNCTLFKVSRKRIQSSLLKSIQCTCFNENVNEYPTTSRIEYALIGNTNQSLETPTCKGGIEDEIFLNFTKHGKKIIGVGRNYK